MIKTKLFFQRKLLYFKTIYKSEKKSNFIIIDTTYIYITYYRYNLYIDNLL